MEVSNDIGVTISKQGIIVGKRLPPRNPGSGPILAKFVRRETMLALRHIRKSEELNRKIKFLTSEHF